ncbi:MAG: hypothetical protein QXS54_06640 [Candidatus Methanomethylicaceae archaeon]
MTDCLLGSPTSCVSAAARSERSERSAVGWNSPWLAEPAFLPHETGAPHLRYVVYLAGQARKPYSRIGVRASPPYPRCNLVSGHDDFFSGGA